jgi:hypothetical protein
MTTPRVRSLVSLVAALGLSFTLGGCASAPSRFASEQPASSEDLQPTVRFDNAARQYVHVYLVGEQREWLLGRVEPGARAALRIPAAALDENAGILRLAVLTGQPVSLRAAADNRAAITLAQPATEILSQRWTYSQPLATGQLTSLRLSRGQAR